MHTPSNREGAASAAMSAAAVPRSTGPGRAGTFRLTMFRIVAAATALLLLVAFGTWQSILTPWMDVADSGGHGWVRTPALHRLADSASALLMAAVGVAALFLAIRPTGRSALLAWTAAMLGAIGAAGTVSAAMQGLDVAGAFLFSVAWLAVLVAPLVLLLHPERTAVLRGGTRSGTLGPPAPLARAGLLVLGAAGLSLAAGVVLWRWSGGLFEDPAEDDVVGLALLGASFALGALLCVRGRSGWPALSRLLCGMGTYCVAAGISIAAG